MTTDKHPSPILPAPSWREWIWWLLRHRKLIRVTGESMLPTLAPGDMALVDTRAYRKATPKPGDIVLARHPYQTDLQIIKRAANITDDGRVMLHSDNPRAGTDSRQFGTLNPQRLIGRVTCRLAAPQ